MLSELCTTLPTFIGVCPPEVTASLLPQFCYYIGYYGNNDALCKLSCHRYWVIAFQTYIFMSVFGVTADLSFAITIINKW